MRLHSDYYPLILKKDLMDELNLKINHINYLIDNDYIKSKSIGKKIIISNSSLEKFKQWFNRDDYYTKSETIQILKENGFYVEYIPNIKMYDIDIEKYPYTYQLFKKNKEIDVFTIDKTDFIKKASLSSLLIKLQHIREVDKSRMDEETKIMLESLDKDKMKSKRKNKRVVLKRNY